MDGTGIEIKFQTNLETQTETKTNVVDNNTPAFTSIHAHETTTFKNIFSLPSPSRDELQVHLDNNLIFSQEIKFPTINNKCL